jgi:lipid II:glycine glycyltransferase (peptidoglycan interpeptide bridge formation enzyme)
MLGCTAWEALMASNIDRFRKDLDALVDKGQMLENSMRRDCIGEKEFDPQVKKQFGTKAGACKKVEAFLKSLPPFKQHYQAWYSESLALLRQLLPDRVDDFKRLYEKPKSRKDITFENYHIEDYLQDLCVTRYGSEVVVDISAAIPRFTQQYAMLVAAQKRFESSLFEIRQLVQADLFDS